MTRRGAIVGEMRSPTRPLRGLKTKLPSKICPVCERVFSWRKRWRNTWDRVVYCSEKCQRNKGERG